MQEALQPWKEQGRYHLVHKAGLLRNSVVITANWRTALQGTDIDMDAYSAFATPSSPTAADSSEESPLTTYLLSKKITRLVICGIATDVCVKATALDALQQGFEIILVEDAMKGVKADDSTHALQQIGQHKAATVVKGVRDLQSLISSS